MRREDIALRDAARQGHSRACLAMAGKLFCGNDGLARNYRLGLAYLQQELNRQSPAARLLAAEAVPVDILAAHQLLDVLPPAAEAGSRVAMLKLGIWRMLTNRQHGDGLCLVRRSQRCSMALTDDAAREPLTLVQLLRTLTPAEAEPGELALAAAAVAIAAQDLAQACLCLQVAMAFMPPGPRLAQPVLACVRMASASDGELLLPVELVEQSLRLLCDLGDADAQLALGCALAGASHGRLMPYRMVRSIDPERAAALLLRAGDAGRSEAWLTLAIMVPGFRSALTHQGMARYFLEKAARAGLAPAQLRLGAVLLKEAVSMESAEPGLHWLHSAAQQGSVQALELLNTLVLPLPDLPASFQSVVIAKATALDRETGERLALARALHLTRHEALHFNARRDLRPWGIVIPGNAKENPRGRLAPVTSAAMKATLAQAAAFFGQASPMDGALGLQRSRMLRQVLLSLSLTEAQLFAPAIGRSWSHPGYGRHWAARTGDLLARILHEQGNKSALTQPELLTAA
jgi:TPR repeat protein